jgi:hypothetical protein
MARCRMDSDEDDNDVVIVSVSSPTIGHAYYVLEHLGEANPALWKNGWYVTRPIAELGFVLEACESDELILEIMDFILDIDWHVPR